jgi:histidinol-phosphate/aromatic aminotransferase/cobyric acid decarboxylase-like protein
VTAHGGDGARVARRLGLPLEDIVDLSASLNPFAPDLAALVSDAVDAVGRYPDPEAATAALAAAMGVAADRLVLTNGGAEAIALVADELGAGDVVDPEFSLYRRHLRDVRPGAGRWRSNPSNPLGALAAEHERAMVWDEAFWPLATGTWTRGDDAAWRLGSLTKLWSCPGLRLGYVVAPDAAAAARVADRQPRWAVNGIALAVVEPLLADGDLPGWARGVRHLREHLATTLGGLGFDVAPTDANWVLVRSARPLRDELAGHGVVVRDCASFGLAGTFRVALPRPEHLNAVVRAFAAVAA